MFTVSFLEVVDLSVTAFPLGWFCFLYGWRVLIVVLIKVFVDFISIVHRDVALWAPRASRGLFGDGRKVRHKDVIRCRLWVRGLHGSCLFSFPYLLSG